MSQGYCGVVHFGTDRDNSLSYLDLAGHYLKSPTHKGEFSCIKGEEYLLAMRRATTEVFEQPTVIRRDGLNAVAAIHGEYHNYNSLLQDNSLGCGPVSGDLDLVLGLYRKEGPHFARKLNGLFSLAIIDEAEKSCYLLNDRFGMAHQLYWTVRGGRLYFATHLKSLLGFPDTKREVDTEGLNIFLKYSYITSPWTIFKGIQKLPPGHLLTFRDGRAQVSPFWGFKESSHEVCDWDEAISTYRDLLQQSIGRRLGSTCRTGILLSGGLDSSANVALAARCTDKQLNTFAIGFEDPRFDERPYAQIVAKHFNTNHREYTITGKEIEDLPRLLLNIEEPYFEFGLFLTYCGLASASPEVDAVIGGEGADQMFGTGGFAGGRPAAAQYLLRSTGLMGPARVARGILKGPFFQERDNLAFKLRLFCNRATDLNDWFFYGFDEGELAQVYKDPALSEVPRIFYGQQVDGSSFEAFYRNTQIHQDIRHYVNENVMVKSGRMADMLGVTLRESFLDVDLADFLLSLDYRFKRSGSLWDHFRGRVKSKLIHRKAMEGLLPTEILNKPKQGGFVPVMLFLKDAGLRQRIYNRLLNSKVMGEYFRNDHLKTLFAQYETYQSQPVYWPNFLNSKANRILFLLTFDIWHHLYMENDPATVSAPSLSEFLAL